MATSSAVLVELALGEGLGKLRPEIMAGIRTALASSCGSLMEELGLPTTVEVRVTPELERRDQLAIVVDGVREVVALELLAAALAAVTGCPLRHVRWPTLAAFATSAPAPAVVDWISASAREALGRRAGMLLVPAGVEALRASLERIVPGSTTTYPPERLRAVLAWLLDQRVSLRDLEAVAHELEDAAAQAVPLEQLEEALFERLRPAVLEIRLDPDYLAQIAVEEPDRLVLEAARDRFAAGLGVTAPPFHFAPDREVPAGAFVVRLNDVRGVLRWGLAPGTRLVPAPAGDGSGIIDPVAGDTYRLLEAGGSFSGTPMTPLAYIGRCVEAEARAAAACLVDTRTAQAAVGEVASAYPALREEVERQLAPAVLTRLVRSLVAEGVSVRDMRSVLEAAIDFDAVKVAPHLIALDDRLPCREPPPPGTPPDPDDLVAFVRMRLRRALTGTVRGEETLLRAHVVAPDLEDEVLAAAEAWRAGGRAGEGDFVRWCARERFQTLNGVRSAASDALGSSSARERPPVVLTNVGTRLPLRRILADVCPTALVVAYEELTIDTDIRTVGRLAAAAPRTVA